MNDKSRGNKKGLTYEDAGVSIDTMDAGIRDSKELIRSTYRPEVLGDVGHFGGLFALDKIKYNEPVLVSSTDSVGTKLSLFSTPCKILLKRTCF